MGNIYLLYGEEKYDLEQRVEKIKKGFSKLEVGVNLFYINKENIEKIDEIAQGFSFFGSEKLIIIKDLKLKFDVSKIIDLDKDTTVIVIEDTVDKRLSEYKKISKIAECIEFKQMNERQITSYIMQLLKKYNKSILIDDATYMQSVCGVDKGNIINELQKLVLYKEDEPVITKEDIDTVCSKTLNSKIFDVLDKIVNRQNAKAIVFVDELLKQKESIVKIYIMLYKQIKQMYMIKYLKERKEDNIATVLGIHPFVFKNLSRACDKYRLDELKQLIFEFDEYDEKTKIGEMDFEIGLKKIICSM